MSWLVKNKKTTNTDTRKKKKRNQCARKILLGWWKIVWTVTESIYAHICDWLRLFLEAENFLCFRLLGKKMVIGISSAFFLHAWFKFGLIGVFFPPHHLRQSKQELRWQRGRKWGPGQEVLDLKPMRILGQFYHLWKGSREVGSINK